MLAVLTELLTLEVDDATLLDEDCKGVSDFHYILHLDDRKGTIQDLRNVPHAENQRKTMFNNFTRCKEHKRLLKIDFDTVEQAITDCKKFNMISNVQKIRMLQMMNARTSITWGNVIS